VELYQGELLPGHYEEWVFNERQRLAEACLDALGRLVHLWEQAGDLDRAVEYENRHEDVQEKNLELNLALGSEREKLAYLSATSWMIDRTISLANHAAEVIRRNPRLELICEPQLSTVVFRVLPASAGIDSDELSASIRQQLFHTGRAVIGHTRVRNHSCLKFTCMNPAAGETGIEALIEEILRLSNSA